MIMGNFYVKDGANRMEHNYFMLLMASFGWTIEGFVRFLLWPLMVGQESWARAPFIGGLLQVIVASIAACICFLALSTKFHNKWFIRALLVLHVFVFYSFIVDVFGVQSYVTDHNLNTNRSRAYYVFTMLTTFCYSGALFCANSMFTIAILDGYSKKEYTAKSYSIRLFVLSLLLFLSGIFMLIYEGIVFDLNSLYPFFPYIPYNNVNLLFKRELVITTGVFSAVIGINGLWLPFFSTNLLLYIYAGHCMFNYLWQLIVMVMYGVTSTNLETYFGGIGVLTIVVIAAINGLPAYFALQKALQSDDSSSPGLGENQPLKKIIINPA